MNYTTPTTKTQMYESLKSIYQYYRVPNTATTPVTFTQLNLSQITITTLTTSQINTKAQTLLNGELLAEKREKKEKINLEIVEQRTQLSQINTTYQTRISAIQSNYEDRIKEAKEEIVQKGMFRSTVSTDLINELITQRDNEITALNTEKTQAISAINTNITALSTQLSTIDSDFQTIYNAKVQAKAIELTDEQNKLNMEYTQYNNSITEKNVKYANTLIQQQKTLQLKEIEIRSNPYTKEELVDMGYYADVISCVNDYYSTLTPATAYSDMLTETKLMFYLDDFYQQTLALYQIRAS